MEAIMRLQEFTRLADHVAADAWELICRAIVELEGREVRGMVH